MVRNKLMLMMCIIGITFSISAKVLASNDTQRIWGSDRYGTAIEVSKNGWTDGSQYAVLANGENFPDALSASPLAKKYNAPILLNPSANLDSRVENEIKRLGVKQVFIIGGSAVISDTIKDKLEGLNIKVIRIWGQNRYETSIKVAEQLDFNGQVSVANGENFPDALSIAPIAGQKSMPVILVPPNTLPDAVAKYIENNKITKSYIVGQNDVVSDTIVNSFPNSERIWGNSRYDTNIAILNKFKDDLDISNIYLANGENFPDALAGSVLASKKSTGVLLLSDSIGQGTKEFMLDKLPSINNLEVLGGKGVITDNLINKIIYPDINNIVNLPKDVLTERQGEWIYYSAESNRRSTLSKCKIDGTSVTQLSNKNVTQFTVIGDWIYFISLEEESPAYLYKIKTDGTGETKLNDERCNWFKIVDNKIYYTSINGTTGAYSFTIMDIDGSNKVNIPVDGMIINPNLVNDYFYYVEQPSAKTSRLKIYKMKTDGTDKSEVYSDESKSVFSLKVYNDWLYFITVDIKDGKATINKMKLDGTEKTSIVDSSIYSFSMSGDWIYYFTADNRWLSKIKIDGSEKTKISDVGNGRYVTAVKDGWIYYNVAVDEYWIPHKIRIDGTDDTNLNPWM